MTPRHSTSPERDEDGEHLIGTEPNLPASDRAFFAQLLAFMQRTDARFDAGSAHMKKLDDTVGDVGVEMKKLDAQMSNLRNDMRTYVMQQSKINTTCAIISTGILAMFLFMRVLGPIDLREWRGLRGLFNAAQAQQAEKAAQ